MSSPASSSSSASSIHHASLVDPATHSPALLELIDVKVSRQVIDYVVDRVVETVDFAMGRPTPSSSRGRTASRRPEHAKFTTFVDNVLTRAEVTMSTLLATLVYIDRSKPHLHIGLEQWALERVFLGALIVASKYLNDSTLKNMHWALCTGVFGKRDVGRIEREYLDVLNFELKITEDDLLSHHQGLSEVIDHLVHSPRAPVEQALPTPTPRRHAHRRALPLPTPSKVPELSPSHNGSADSDSDSSFYSPRTPSEASSMHTTPEDFAVEIKTRYPAVQLHPAVVAAPQHAYVHAQVPQGTMRKMFNAVTKASTKDMLDLFPSIPRVSTS